MDSMIGPTNTVLMNPPSGGGSYLKTENKFESLNAIRNE